MRNTRKKMIYALQNDEIVCINEVESGIKCNCICPACGEQLIARKGTKVMHHFAHKSNENCEHGYETSLHLAAKTIIAKHKYFMLPTVKVSFVNSPKPDILLYEAQKISIDEVYVERKFNDITPDIIIKSGGKYLMIEIFVTHKIDESKLLKIKNANISTIEIDLSKIESDISEEMLEDILVSDSDVKKWKFNAKADAELKKFYAISDKRKIISRNYAMQVDNCPIRKRVYKHRPYANYTDDCLCCKYCISSKYEDGILCSGKARISTLEDMMKTEEERIKESNIEMEKRMLYYVDRRRCPYCDGDLVERESKLGTFLGCKNYPHCQFTWNSGMAK